MFRIIALAFGLTAAPLPAAVETLEYRWLLRSPEERAAVRFGMMSYSVSQRMKSSANVSQKGDAHRTMVRQSSHGLHALMDHMAATIPPIDGAANAMCISFNLAASGDVWRPSRIPQGNWKRPRN